MPESQPEQLYRDLGLDKATTPADRLKILYLLHSRIASGLELHDTSANRIWTKDMQET